jgi:hypothetical protein
LRRFTTSIQSGVLERVLQGINFDFEHLGNFVEFRGNNDIDTITVRLEFSVTKEENGSASLQHGLNLLLGKTDRVHSIHQLVPVIQKLLAINAVIIGGPNTLENKKENQENKKENQEN